MRVQGFRVLVEPDPQGGFVVTCPSLPGCYSQGDILELARANLHEAIVLYQEEKEQHGMDAEMLADQ